MSKEKIIGNCKICNKFTELTEEHVPPKSAFNNSKVIKATTEQILSSGIWDGRYKNKKQIQQGGSRYNTLCEKCNNTTGSHYADEYRSWAEQAAKQLIFLPNNGDRIFPIYFNGYPLRFLKQIVTMFMSLNNDSFSQIHPDLVNFIKDKNECYLPAKYHFNLVLVNGKFARKYGIYSEFNCFTGEKEIASEIAHYPFGIRMIIKNPIYPRFGVIENFAKSNYNDKREIIIYTIAGEVYTKYPGDYRNKEQVMSDYLNNIGK